MTQDGRRANPANAPDPAKLASDFNQKLREPLTKSLPKLHPLPEENPPELDKLLTQLRDATGE